jgi:hypothetical protein
MVQLITVSQNISVKAVVINLLLILLRPLFPEIKQLIDRLLLERISLRGIARVTQVSLSWLQDYVNQKLAQTPRQVKVLGKITS